MKQNRGHDIKSEDIKLLTWSNTFCNDTFLYNAEQMRKQVIYTVHQLDKYVQQIVCNICEMCYICVFVTFTKVEQFHLSKLSV